MENTYLAKILPFLNEIEKSRREQFEQYFRTAPMWLMETFAVEELEEGTVFVQEGEPADMIYFIGKGLIKATDYRIYGINYDFMMFEKVYAFGGMEVIINLDKYQTTLQTATKCTVLKIPKEGFKKWLDSDIIALKQESRLMGEYLLEQARDSRMLLFLQGADRVAFLLMKRYRKYAHNVALKQESRLMGEYLLEQARDSRMLLFLQGADRVAFLLMKRYRKYAHNGVLRMKGDRQDLSDFTGLCLKTISRSIKKFKENGMISMQGSYILINYEQYRRMKDMIADILAEDL